MQILHIFIALFVVNALNAQQDNEFKTKWDNGFKVESVDKQFKMKFGGRIMYDLAFFSQDDSLEANFGKLKSGAEFRRARFFSSGTIYYNVKYKMQLDFAGGKVSFKDVYLQFSKIPLVGNFRVGHFKEPFRLEVLTSSNYITFMERGLHIPFSLERSTGAMIFNEELDHRLGWQLGIFRNSDQFGNAKNTGSDYNVTARLSALLINDKENRRLLQLGAAYSSRSPESDEYKLSARPAAHLAPKYVSTGTIMDINKLHLFNVEAALVLGSFSAQGEYLSASVNNKDSGALSFSGYHAQISYFLTGEHRRYKNHNEGFDRLNPKSNAGNGTGGKGAWELALRYEAIDLDDGTVNGGKLSDITAGLNWYLNPATRIMANYVFVDLDGVGQANIIQTRFQLSF